MPVTELLAQFANPEVIHTLSLTDKLIAGLVATFLGMGITFAALIVLQFVIVLMEKLTNSPGKTDSEKSKIIKPATPIQDPTISADNQLIAVISTVIALQLKTSVSNIVVRNIEKIDNNPPTWQRAGIIEQMNNRR